MLDNLISILNKGFITMVMVKSRRMDAQTEGEKTHPPSLIGCLRKGFDAIANHVVLILFPITLDAFLWLGPRLKVTRLVERMLASWHEFYSSGALPNDEALRIGQQVWGAIGERLNLFIFLRTYPIGVFSLMAGVQPIYSPFVEPLVIQVSSLRIVFFTWLACSLVGLLAGSIYFSLVAQAAVQGSIDWVESIKSWVRNSLHSLTLTVFWFSIIALVGLPCSCLISLLTFGNLAAAQFGVIVMIGVMIWLLLPLVFSPHGIFVYSNDVWKSIKQSIQLTRFTFPNTLVLLLIVFTIGEGMDIIWRFPKETSWLTLIGIAGHGFVTSALLATTFVYYREATIWVNDLLRKAETVSVS